MAILAAVCTKMPEAKLAIIFLPMFTFTAGNVSENSHSRHQTAPVRFSWGFMAHNSPWWMLWESPECAHAYTIIQT